MHHIQCISTHRITDMQSIEHIFSCCTVKNDRWNAWHFFKTRSPSADTCKDPSPEIIFSWWMCKIHLRHRQAGWQVFAESYLRLLPHATALLLLSRTTACPHFLLQIEELRWQCTWNQLSFVSIVCTFFWIDSMIFETFDEVTFSSRSPISALPSFSELPLLTINIL